MRWPACSSVTSSWTGSPLSDSSCTRPHKKHTAIAEIGTHGAEIEGHKAHARTALRPATLAAIVASKRDYYEVIGVSRTASEDEIKRAYRKIAIECHADRNPDNQEAENRFKQATEAYSVLSDSEKRRRYDKMGHSGFGADGPTFDQVDFSSFGDLLEGLIGEMFGGSKRGRTPRDLKYDLELNLSEAALGCTKQIHMERNSICAVCGGTGCKAGHTPPPCQACGGKGEVRYQKGGIFPTTRQCSRCKGTGKLISEPCHGCGGDGLQQQGSSLDVSIPPGIEDGSVRTVRGGGERNRAGDGDLHIHIHIKDHPLFTRDGADLLCNVPISYPQAVLGDQLEVPTLEGKVRMRLPPGTPSGKVFRLRGKGVAALGGVGKGDQLVKVVVEVPREVSKRQQELLEELATDMGEHSLPQRRTFREKLRSLFE